MKVALDNNKKYKIHVYTSDQQVKVLNALHKLGLTWNSGSSMLDSGVAYPPPMTFTIKDPDRIGRLRVFHTECVTDVDGIELSIGELVSPVWLK